MSKPVYSIGIGTGDPELITLKAKRLLEESDIVFVPQSSQQGKSVAREIVLNFIPESKIVMYFFPMTNDADELFNRYSDLAKTIKMELDEGKSISYVTMGDPTIFSTSNYLTERLDSLGVKVVHIPGINTINAASTMLGLPLCVKGENFAVYEMPTEVDKASELIARHSTTVFMKVNKKLPILIECVKKAQPDIAYLVRRMGLDDEMIFDLKDAGNPPDAAYLSVAVIKNKGNRYCNNR
ncbi:precorrin-2 C(20)-methyltransferase [bacterium]|nr:precorrin-2 C(20)-methyltransferase [bacterium]